CFGPPPGRDGARSSSFHDSSTLVDQCLCSSLALAFLGLLARADRRHALLVVVQDDDAFQALDAFVVIDTSDPVYRADTAVISAVLAGLAAGVDPLQP